MTHRKLFGEKDPIVVNVMAKYGQCLTDQKQWDESQKVLEQTLALMTCKENRDKNLPVGPVRLHLAQTYAAQGNDKNAEQQILIWKSENKNQKVPADVKRTLKTLDLHLKVLRERKQQLQNKRNQAPQAVEKQGQKRRQKSGQDSRR